MVRVDIPVAFFAFASLVSAWPIQRSPGIVGIPISRKTGTLTALELVVKEKYRIASFASSSSAVGNQPITNEDGKYIHVLIGVQCSLLTANSYVVSYVAGEVCMNST
jgi:hypothetical protein